MLHAFFTSFQILTFLWFVLYFMIYYHVIPRAVKFSRYSWFVPDSLPAVFFVRYHILVITPLVYITNRFLETSIFGTFLFVRFAWGLTLLRNIHIIASEGNKTSVASDERQRSSKKLTCHFGSVERRWLSTSSYILPTWSAMASPK